jgi:hypothetical protein
MLILDPFAGSPVEALLPIAARQGQSVDQGIGGRANLAQGDLWIFSP